MPVQMHYILARRQSALLLLTLYFHYIPTGFKIPEAEVLRGKVKIKNIKVLGQQSNVFLLQMGNENYLHGLNNNTK